jgi:hypothetical protein
VSGECGRAASETKYWCAILVFRAVRVAIFHLTVSAGERESTIFVVKPPGKHLLEAGCLN